MTYKNSLTWDCLDTLAAVIWSLPSVNLHVGYKIAIILESLATLVALIWPLSSVISHMMYKIVIYRKCFVTVDALIFSPPQCESSYAIQDCQFMGLNGHTAYIDKMSSRLE